MPELRLDPNISISAVGGPQFNTVSIMADTSGRRQAIELWPRDLRVWKVNFVVRWKGTSADALASVQRFQRLVSFFRVCRGSSRSFRFKDWTDYKDDGGGYVKDVGGVLRLVKRYDDGFGGIYELPVYKPVPGTITFSAGASGTLNPQNGIVTGGTAGRWAGEYDVWVHFVDDGMNYSSDPGGIIKWEGVTVMEDVVDD